MVNGQYLGLKHCSDTTRSVQETFQVEFFGVDATAKPIFQFGAVCVDIKRFRGDDYVGGPVIPAWNKVIETDGQINFGRQVIDVRRDRRAYQIDERPDGRMRQRVMAFSLVADNLACCLTKSAVGSQFNMPSKAFVGLVRSAPVI